MQLTTAEAQAFQENGFVKLDGAVPPDRVVRALRSINHEIGDGIDPAKLDQFRSQTYAPNLTSTDAITSTFNDTGLRELFASLLGVELPPSGGAQIALRFPSLGDEVGDRRPHIDGTYSPHNGVPLGTIASFTALCHILLSDLPDPNCGNFMVWPGTHHAYTAHFRDKGFGELVNGTPRVDLPEPVQITGNAGDAVIAHYMVGHSFAAHVGPNIRYGLFFRVKHPEHMAQQEYAITDPWFEWPGLRNVIRSYEKPIPAAYNA